MTWQAWHDAYILRTATTEDKGAREGLNMGADRLELIRDMGLSALGMTIEQLLEDMANNR